MTKSKSKNLITFLETLHSILREVAIVSCTFTNPQLVNLLLVTLTDI